MHAALRCARCLLYILLPCSGWFTKARDRHLSCLTSLVQNSFAPEHVGHDSRIGSDELQLVMQLSFCAAAASANHFRVNVLLLARAVSWTGCERATSTVWKRATLG